MNYMAGRKVLFSILIIVFLVAMGLIGIYLYNVLFPKQNLSTTAATTTTVTPTPASSSEKTVILTSIKNGGNSNYPQTVGGIDDYNNNGTIPADSYHSNWTACNDSNNYCKTGDKFAEKKDENTGLVWSTNIGDGINWFTANNCKYPNGLLGSDDNCNTDGDQSCECVKHIGLPDDLKTGCEALNGKGWRLPYQKELMQAYIDGSWSSLSDPHKSYWSATTRSNETQSAWATYLSYGNTSRDDKTMEESVRCVR